MKIVALLCLSVFIVTDSSRSIETDVRMLVSNAPRGPFKPCSALRNGALDHWRSHLFAYCDFKDVTFHVDPRVEFQFEFDIRVDNLPTEYRDLRGAYLAWYVNRLLNNNGTECPMATGKERRISYNEFLLVGPKDVAFCNSLLKMELNNTGMKINNCEVVQQRTKPVDGYILATYRLSVVVDMKEKFPLNPMLFLYKLNGDRGCLYNGYWAPRRQTIFDYDEDDDDIFVPEPDVDNIDSEELMEDLESNPLNHIIDP